MGAKTLSIRSNFQLINAQIKGEYKVKESLLVRYVRATKELLERFDFELERIPREENSQADTLAKLASAKAAVNNRTVIQETIHMSCIENIMRLRTKPSWMTPILHYLRMGKLP